MHLNGLPKAVCPYYLVPDLLQIQSVLKNVFHQP